MSLINLLPSAYIQRRAQRRANLLCVCLFGVVMTGVMGADLVTERSQRHTAAVRESVNRAYADAGRTIQQMQELEVTKQKMQSKANMTAALLERVPRSYLLATIAKALPGGSSILKLEMTCKRQRTLVISSGQPGRGGAPTTPTARKEVTPPDVLITLTGLAATDVEVARLITTMARCPIMDTVDLVYSQEKKVNEYIVREFQVVMKLKADADVCGAASPAAAAHPAAAAPPTVFESMLTALRRRPAQGGATPRPGGGQ